MTGIGMEEHLRNVEISFDYLSQMNSLVICWNNC